MPNYGSPQGAETADSSLEIICGPLASPHPENLISNHRPLELTLQFLGIFIGAL